MFWIRRLLAGLALVVVVGACAPVKGAGPRPEFAEPAPPSAEQLLIDADVAALPWPAGEHARFEYDPRQRNAHSGETRCWNETVTIYPKAFAHGADWRRHVIAHEAGHVWDCVGGGAANPEFLARITEFGETTPHSTDWSPKEGLADCLATRWGPAVIPYGTAPRVHYWNCPQELVDAALVHP